jgi:sugar phosphate isomerase/epimerase
MAHFISDPGTRLGLSVARDAWPTRAALAEQAEAGFRWVQLHSPPAAVLGDREGARRHARAVRSLLRGTGLRLVLHAPDTLSVGTPESDAVFAALLDYASGAGAELVAYHVLNFPDSGSDAVGERVRSEEAVLPELLQRAPTLGITVALENLCPVYPSPPRLSHDPLAVRDLVRRLGLPGTGMLLDLGHLHVTCDAAGEDVAAVAAACAPDTVLVHAHDNFGARRRDVTASGVDPLRLDLHLAPGSGTLPWPRVARALAGCDAPLVLEVKRQHLPAATADLHRRAAAAMKAPRTQQLAA